MNRTYILIISMLIIQISYSQEKDSLFDCSCIKKGECIQYLDSILKPTTKDKAVYMRYNYKYRKRSFEIMEYISIKPTNVGRKFQNDTIVKLDGIYQWYYKERVQYEVHYKEGHLIKSVQYGNPKNKFYTIVEYNKPENPGEWSYIYENYMFDQIMSRGYVKIINGKPEVIKTEKFKINFPNNSPIHIYTN